MAMARSTAGDHEELGRRLLAQFSGRGRWATSLVPVVRGFRERQRALTTAARLVAVALDVRDVALARIKTASAALDRHIDGLANRLKASELRSRRNPFSAFAEIPPARIKELAFSRALERVSRLVASVERVGGSTSVQDAIRATRAAVAEGRAALDALAEPQTAYAAALAAHDALLPEWVRAFERLRLHLRALSIARPG